MALQDEVVTKVALLNEGQDSSNIFYIRVVNSNIFLYVGASSMLNFLSV